MVGEGQASLELGASTADMPSYIIEDAVTGKRPCKS